MFFRMMDNLWVGSDTSSAGVWEAICRVMESVSHFYIWLDGHKLDLIVSG